MKTPGPDHPITIEPAANRWRARVGGHVIADSNDALILREATLPPRVYFPRADVAMEYMSKSERTTHCPYKGDASYYTLFLDGKLMEDVVWSYEAPFPAMEAIEGRLSFYPDRVEVYEVDEALVNPEARTEPVLPDDPSRIPDRPTAPFEPRVVGVDEVVQHTDAGDGRSQRARWPADGETPGATDAGGLRLGCGSDISLLIVIARLVRATHEHEWRKTVRGVALQCRQVGDHGWPGQAGP